MRKPGPHILVWKYKDRLGLLTTCPAFSSVNAKQTKQWRLWVLPLYSAEKALSEWASRVLGRFAITAQALFFPTLGRKA
jgi:hypothetical protein